MRNMKRILIAVVIAAVLAAGGTAIAGGGWRKYGGDGSGRGGMRMGHRGWSETCPMRGGALAQGNEVPQEIKDKMTEARKTMIDLRAEFGKNPVSRAKVLELHAKRLSLVQEISEWRIMQRLDAAGAK